jgi:hypothetical protein
MVESAARNGTSSESADHLGQAITNALAFGVTTEEILSMLQTAVLDTKAERPDIPSHVPDPESIFTELPDGCIDLTSAAKKYGIKLTTLHYWLRQGHLTSGGRLRAPATGGAVT